MRTKPNILLIMCDQLRADTLDCYGDTVCDTPNIDKFADESVVFSNAYTSCPICSPARASVQTGVYPFRHGMINNIYNTGCMAHELPEYSGLLGRKMQQLGYGTGYTGKWHMGGGGLCDDCYSEEFPLITPSVVQTALPSARGYDKADDFPHHGARGVNYRQFREYLESHNLELDIVNNDETGLPEIRSSIETTVEYFLIENTKKYIDEFITEKRPFFFMLNFWGPHSPYLSMKEHIELYKKRDITPWKNFYDIQVGKPLIHRVKGANTKHLNWNNYLPTIWHYFGGMTLTDIQIGRLFEFLKEKNIYDDTVIIFMSDHGNALGCHGGLNDKAQYFYDDTCKIPLILKAAGNKQVGRIESHFANTCDIYSTILEYAGMRVEEAEQNVHGHSLVATIEKSTANNSLDCVVTECDGLLHKLMSQRMIRWKNYKYVYNLGDIDEFYDMEKDPYEMVNLLNSPLYQTDIKAIRERLFRWMIEHDDGLVMEYSACRDLDNIVDQRSWYFKDRQILKEKYCK